MPTRQGSIHLVRVAGIDLYLHWSWFVVAFYEINARRTNYSSLAWNALEYLALFCIILLHEFGHALACRSVGGRADQIVLWPLGGVAYVAPPPRPGATLWSIAAGPLVNVGLAPLLTLMVALGGAGWAQAAPDAYALMRSICFINYFLLIFNLLPIYPLDGGQILRSLLWFVVGRARSLMVSTVLGFIAIGALALLALRTQVFRMENRQNAVWLAVVAAFMLLNCWRGLLHARFLAKVAKLPRREGFACPSCKQPPIRGALWRCGKCQKPFDTFESMAVCPHCGTESPVTLCFECGKASPIHDWVVPVPPATAA